MHSKTDTFLILLGPTGVGKSAMAVKLALKFKGEVINCDSMQVYRGFNIGTDKITAEKMKGVPHHLLDVVDGTCQFTAADFVSMALERLRSIGRRGRLPIIAGGTGLYLKSLLEGLFPEGEKNESIREDLKKKISSEGLPAVRRILEKVDPEYAEKIGPHDRIRIIRALEVYYATGKNMTENFARTKSPVSGYRIIKIGLKMDRKDLVKRIEDRVDRMFEAGLIDEVKQHLDSGLPEDAPPFRALGYQHAVQVVLGDLSRDEAVEMTKRDTRRYAKRQMTWFRSMEGIRWFHPGEESALIDYVAGCLEREPEESIP